MKHVWSSEKKWPAKAVLNRNKINIAELLILDFLIRQLFQPSSLVIYDSDFQRILVELIVFVVV